MLVFRHWVLFEEGASREEVEVHRGADCLCAEAGGDGDAAGGVIRPMGISEQTYYRWKKVYGGLGVGELRRVKQLEDENRKFKQLVVDRRAKGTPLAG